jgi:tetratricopeptide (TPR) repeat protein
MYRVFRFCLVLMFLVTQVWAACVAPAALTSKVKAKPSADTYTALGIWFNDHQQYACAIEAYRSGLKLEQRSPQLDYLLGVSLYASGNPKGAIQPLQESIQLAPKVLKPRLVLAGALEQLQRRSEARAEWVAALQIDPRSVLALDGLSKNLLAQGDYVSVIRLLEGTQRDDALNIDLAMAFEKGAMTDQAEDVLRKALQKTPSSENLTRTLVTLLVLHAHFEEGAKVASKLVALHPGDMDAQKLYLHVLVLNDDIDLAKPLARKLLKIAPHDFEVLYLNGVLERESGDYQAARGHLEAAVAMNPNYYNSRYNLGVVLEQLNDLKGAREQFEKALALGAWEPEIRFEYANTLRKLGETKLAVEQLKLYQQEQKAKADRTLAASKSAQADKQLASGNVKEAVALYKDAVAALPENAMLQLKLGLALDRTGDTSGEMAALKKAIQLDPNMAVAHDQIGYLASRSGDLVTAEEEFRQAVRDAPAYVEAWVSLAATLGMESRFSDAQKAVETALQIDPQNTGALQLRKDLATAASQAER